MTSAAGKGNKSFGSVPKVMPRPTAASAARAARNATNRNLTQQQVRSPSRSSLSPVKGKSAIQRNIIKTDAETNIKAKQDDETVENVENSKTTIDQLSVVKHCVDNTPDKIGEEGFFEPKQLDTIIDESENDNSATDFTIITDPVCESRPLTPVGQNSTKVLSRPVTPLVASRPSTPKTLVRSNVPSRPNTPQRTRTATGRPKTPNSTSGPTRTQTPEQSRPSSRPADDIKVAFTTKKRQYYRMKKELDFKQQAILEVYDSLRDMHSHLNQEGVAGGGEESLDQDLVLFNVADWTSEEITQLCRDAAESSYSDNAGDVLSTALSIDESCLVELNTKVKDVPADFATLCFEAVAARQELMSWVKELIEKHENGSGESISKIAYYNTQGLQLLETLQELKSQSDSTVGTVTQLLKRAFQERSTLVSVGESLLREVARLRQDLEARVLVANVGRDLDHGNGLKSIENELRRELEEEKLAKSAMKDKFVAAESQLRQTRLRVSKMDKQLREAEASILSLTGTVKSLEDQSRQKEVQLEARARKLRENLKTGEVTNNQLVQQRDAFQTRAQELEDQIKNLTMEHESAINELNGRIFSLNTELEEQMKLKENEIKIKEEIIIAFNESNKKIEDLTDKLTKLKQFKTNSEIPTEREIHLLSELQATKEILNTMEDEVTTYRREKVRFLETFTKITESETKTTMQKKLAAELVSKEDLVAKMQIQIRDLEKHIKLNEEKVKQYELYVMELRAHNRAIASSHESADVIHYQDLQEEIMNLKTSLLETTHRNDELSEMLAEKEQKLEQQDKTSRAQARVIKVREELINLLKNKETEQSKELAALQQDLEHRMKIVEEVNKQIAAKANEIQELFATQECKQQQIHRLEKIVLALEEQQKRSQALRTRHEEKIAALEHELADGNRRERKFLFF